MDQARSTPISVATCFKRDNLQHYDSVQPFIELLLKYRANVTTPLKDGMTLLHAHCSAGGFVEPILSFGFDLELLDYLGRKLLLASFKRHGLICGNARLPFS